MSDEAYNPRQPLDICLRKTTLSNMVCVPSERIGRRDLDCCHNLLGLYNS